MAHFEPVQQEYTKISRQTCELHLHNLVDLLEFCLHTIAKVIKSVKISPGGRSFITGVIFPYQIGIVTISVFRFTELTSSPQGQATQGHKWVSQGKQPPLHTDEELPLPHTETVNNIPIQKIFQINFPPLNLLLINLTLWGMILIIHML